MESSILIDDLPRECLSKIISNLSARDRASSAALVSKLWNEAEAYTPYQPTHLDLQPSDLNESYIRWHLRDASKLQEVASLYESNSVQPPSHWDALHLLLQRVCTGVPQLHNLELVLMKEDPEGRHRQWKEGGAPLSVRPLGEFGPPFRFLPLVGEMGALRTLCLRPWMCPREDVPLIHHLERLTNLETLELANFRFEVARTDPGGWVEDAGLRLSSALQSLSSLTELRLQNVHCTNLFPLQGMGNLTNLRALLVDDEDDSVFPLSGVGDFVGLTRLAVPDQEGLPDQLAALSNLRDLTYRIIEMLEKPLLVSQEAQLTKLYVFGISIQGLRDILPDETVRNVRDLTLCWEDYWMGDDYLYPQWPDDWTRLMGHLTSLGYHFRDMNHNLHIPPVLKRLQAKESLVRLELSATFANFIDPGRRVLCSLWKLLPALREMQIHILLLDSEHFKRSLAIESVEEVCRVVCAETGDLQSSTCADVARLPPGIEELAPNPDGWLCIRLARPAAVEGASG